MIYTLFFSRMRPLDADLQADYSRRQADLLACARRNHPGFVDSKSFVAEDGERLTVVRFRDAASQEAWRRDAAHAATQGQGRAHFDSEYRSAVCEELRSRAWSHVDDVASGAGAPSAAEDAVAAGTPEER